MIMEGLLNRPRGPSGHGGRWASPGQCHWKRSRMTTKRHKKTTERHKANTKRRKTTMERCKMTTKKQNSHKVKLFCGSYSLGVLLLCRRGGGPFTCLCPAACCLIIRPWSWNTQKTSQSTLLALLSVDETAWPQTCLHVSLQPSAGLHEWICGVCEGAQVQSV